MPGPSLLERIKQLEQLLDADPDNVPVRQELLRYQARYLTRTGDPDVRRSFADNLEVLYALNPRDPLVGELLAGQVDAGYQPPPPADPEAREAFQRALVLAEEGARPRAERAFREALLAAPDCAAVHCALARMYLSQGQPAAARPHLDWCLAQPDPAPLVLALAGEARVAEGQDRDAVELFLRALALNPLCAPAEQHLVALGTRLGFRWVKVPLQPGVWPLIQPDGRHWMVAAQQLPRGARRAWQAWAEAVVRLCRQLPPEAVPLAGLPRRLDLLRESHEVLLSRWRRARRWRLPRPVHPAEAVLNWLSGVDQAGLLEAYLFYSYLHPDLATEFQAWRRREPAALMRFLRDHVMHWSAGEAP